MRRSTITYARRRVAIWIRLKLRMISVDIAGALVKLAFWICPQLEKSMREMYGRAWSRKQLSEIEDAYEAYKLTLDDV